MLGFCNLTHRHTDRHTQNPMRERKPEVKSEGAYYNPDTEDEAGRQRVPGQPGIRLCKMREEKNTKICETKRHSIGN